MKKIFNLLSATVVALTMVTGCVKPESTLVEFAEDNRIDTPNDSVYSVMGIINKLQALADRTILLGEIRGDLTTLTPSASADLREMASSTMGTDNVYNSPADYYAVIQNCNFYLANVDTALSKRGEKIFTCEFAAVKAFRAWTYLQLALNYGEVPFFTEPLLTEKDAQVNRHPKKNVSELCDFFVKDLSPYVDTKYPGYGNINGYNSQYFYFPVRLVLGDYCLWAGRYAEAATYYHDFLTNSSYSNSRVEMSIGNSYTRWYDNEFKILSSSTSAEPRISFIPMETDESNGIISYLRDIFCSTDDNKYYYEATVSPAYFELSAAQRYVMVYTDPITQLKDTLTPPEDLYYRYAYLRGDLRLYHNYTQETTSASDNYSKDYQSLYKYTSSLYNSYVCTIYTIPMIYLRLAEAMNRAGLPQSAFAILKYGLYNETIAKYISEEEQAKAGNLLEWSQYRFTYENTLGIHSRGSGDAGADTTYVIPELPTMEDSILFVEDKLCNEMALETSFEGTRFYDLMRLSMHRGDPSFLADKVARRGGASAYDATLFDRLKVEKNWYLPLE